MPPRTLRLACSYLRVDVGGVPAIDGLTLASTGDHVLVLGAARALFEAAAGLRAAAHGDLRVEGIAPIEASRSRVVGCAPRDPPLPDAWTAFDYAAWSARLAGHGRTTAHALAKESLARLQIEPTGRTPLAAATQAVRRATVLAAAMATGAQTLLIEDPIAGLADDAGDALARSLVHFLGDRFSVIFAPRIALTSPLALAADEAIVIDGSEVAAQGAPAGIAAQAGAIAVRAVGHLGDFQRAIDARGGQARMSTAALLPAHVRVELGPLTARDVLQIAAECGTIVVELRPLARMFA